ncbi:7-deoxyloganetin glucosyltransferase [Ziziphus jujuba]|uniref:Glycosyltransferase n=1 Tax=Ziziphus jujuba TaxID=326968 RepID=A0ABM3IG86_ZIZJJ|nr:7-deoxyloganetin glucosyltransferase [Ziziphus jujuba]XP_048327757.1 7-deoxyloganetin glucosyltransferase [Ziziphus jujuba]XP_048327758.1 7-deoxyloganetin glucosyltransferase [Ziziphus jujuba]XP_048327759.1 7-deoxyloganetin glucosyltransferase [Ziziphus jujuba]XP_048327760.1 7-deoxyloganetin glucosyltransferase [Ziziphus jujuba]XP_048327761.1 7-deoxyloganetin glucosyltransferase [Ziziphus jujuba]XP_048327762.1 7-deoxyloganetin glucosyltransferase [Ziziphus jujuba]XP_048327763.1 7-deoxylog
MGSRTEADSKSHVLCIPWPAQSHIKAMLKLAKLLHSRGFHITFVNTEYNHKRFLKSLGPDSLQGLPDFRFETIPDGLPPSDNDTTQDVFALCRAVQENMLAPFRDLLKRLNDNGNSNMPPVTSIVSDATMLSFTITAGEELGIPVVLLYTISACSFMGMKQYHTVVEKLGHHPSKDIVIDWIPGMKDIHVKDLPSSPSTANPEDCKLLNNFSSEATNGAHKATAVIYHTFYALEKDVLDALSAMLPRVFAIGPLELLLNGIKEDALKLNYSLWKEESECLQWLDTKAPNSVLYVNFGSVAMLSKQQLVEFAFGLANSKHPFVWIIRPDLVIGESAILPPEFVNETKERSLIASWCSQEELLNHPSIGGFLTHSGWNSTIESLSSGVPMLCWPFYGDQPMNCRYTCKEWGIGLKIDNEVKREEVEKLVRELMEGERGKNLKRKVMEWKRLAEEAIAPDGSSSKDFDSLVRQFL